MKHVINYLFVFAFLFFMPMASVQAQGLCPSGEPDVELAKLWWPDQRNMWTPIGWKDHYFKFNVIYNGALMCEPAPGRPHTKDLSGQNFLLTFNASGTGIPAPQPKSRLATWKIDGGHGVQGWTKGHETPVLWTEYRSQAGIVLKSEIFGHITSNDDVVTALEPLYAWVRLSVSYIDPLRSLPETYPMSVQLTRYNLTGMANYCRYDVSLDIVPENAPYPKLALEPWSDEGQTGYRITESDEKVRMIVAPTKQERISFEETSEGIYNLKVVFNAVEGDYVDLLVPMLPQPREEIEKELALGYDGALAMSDQYWSRKPETAASFHVPERFINEALAQNIKFAPIIAELDCVTKEYSYLSGSWIYSALWATPTSMVSHMFIDQMGYFDMTKKYSEIFYKNQGTVKAPGNAYQLHPGYFSTPKTLTSIDWLTDHGAVMQQLATHGLLTGDKEFIDHWTGPLEKACDFIVEYSTKAKDHGGIEGLLPPGVATDDQVVMQAVWNIAWTYKGMLTTVRLFEKTGHPKAGQYRTFLEEYKKLFVKEYRKIAEEGTRWTDSQGRKRYKPSTYMSNVPTHFYEPFYLDTGPLVLVWAELMEPDDPIMVDTVDFFREGPNWKLINPRLPAAGLPPVLIHEMSSCEPCYSWNVFHAWKLGDRQRFLEGMYSIMVGSISQDTYISCEHRHAVQGTMFSFPLGFYLAKLSVIDDQISYGDLHLMRLCPHAWITSNEETWFAKMPTELGPVNLRFRRSADGKTLNVSFSAQWREKPGKVILHVPQMPGLEKINVNGQSYSGVKEIYLEI